MKNGYLVISLDFELLWGVFDVLNFSNHKEYFRNTRQVIPRILKSFEEKGIHSTWATVGMLFNQNWEEWEKHIPERLPGYYNQSLSAYDFASKHSDEALDELCFAPDLIKLISKFPGQEIATHTYSHYYCLEPAQDIYSFRDDLEKAVFFASQMNIELKSLVFPRNQINQEYLKTCWEFGIKNVRSNPSSWYWKDATTSNIYTKLARTGDAYFSLGKKTYKINDLIKSPHLPVEQKASRFYRPVEENNLLRRLKLKRVKGEMRRAAQNNEVYHLWWHPHNFGTHPQESMDDLNDILFHFGKLQEEYNYQSVNMAELGEMIS